MGKISGIETQEQLPPKVIAMYDAVKTLMEQGHHALDIRVSMITELAGIGKGTAYEYFDTKEELIACAMAYQVQTILTSLQKELTGKEHFAEQIDYMLGMGQKHRDEKQYLQSFMHMLTEPGEVSSLVQHKTRTYVMQRLQSEQESGAARGPLDVLLRGILLSARERGEVRTDQPLEYQSYLLLSKLLTFMLYQCHGEEHTISTEEMHRLVHQGILEELTETKDEKNV